MLRLLILSLLTLICCRGNAFAQTAKTSPSPSDSAQTDSVDATDTSAPATESPTSINDAFLNPDLDVQQFLDRFEIESREVYAARQKVLAACQIQPGMSVADIGAGTGFFSRMFAQTVGSQGWTYAVELSPRFLEHITRQMKLESITNMTAVHCRDNSVDLPPNSIDLAFICDTYHHFEFPRDTLQTIHRALRRDGILVVIDFERIPGKSREWILGHVRAGKETVQDEIQSVGFGFIEQVAIPEFEENYFLRFRKR